MNMEFLYKNYLNTTTMVTPSEGGTSSVNYLFDRDINNKFGSGDTSDLTTTSLIIELDATQTVDRIALQGINLKSFKVYYNSNSANLFSLTSDCETQTSEWTGNSATNLYLILESQTSIKSIFIVATTTIATNEEKQIAELWITRQYYQMEQNPQAKDYKANINRQEYVHTMSDGGTAIYVIADKFQASIKRDYISETEFSTLKTMHQDWSPFVFIPEPTGTSWTGNIYEVNWVGDFDLTWTQNYKETGYNHAMKLMETAK